MATIDVSGARRDISLMLLPEEVQVGDFVIVHAGFALQKIDREAGQEALRLIRELVESEEFKAEYMD
jgi:hydrogenase expression/formation protein HypC